MNSFQGALINRRADIVRLRDERMVLRAPQAHTAGWWVTDWIVTSKEDFKAKIDAISADLAILDEDQKSFALVGQADINNRIQTGQCTGKISPATGYNDCLSDVNIRFQAWFQAFNIFKNEWEEFVAADPGPSDDSVANQKALRLKKLREDYERITKRKIAVTPAPGQAPSGGLFGGAGDTAQSLNTLVWLVGFGFAFYIFTLVAAPLLGGAARTKEQFRQLRG